MDKKTKKLKFCMFSVKQQQPTNKPKYDNNVVCEMLKLQETCFNICEVNNINLHFLLSLKLMRPDKFGALRNNVALRSCL